MLREAAPSEREAWPPRIENQLIRFVASGRVPAFAALCLAAAAAPATADAQLATSAAMPTVAAPQGEPMLVPAVVTSAAPMAASAQATPGVAVATDLWSLIWAKMHDATPLDTELDCVATAVYFEARGEPFEGQLAVAEVVLNRANSGRYPSSYCAVVKQPWQFSFVRNGRFPRIDKDSNAWSYAQAITKIAARRLANKLPQDVLWYHADYVAPSWGRRLSRVEKIGAHIFYRG